MPKLLAFTFDDETVTTVKDEIGAVASRPCPDCEGGKLVLQSQGEGEHYERYLECDNEDCGRALYP